MTKGMAAKRMPKRAAVRAVAAVTAAAALAAWAAAATRPPALQLHAEASFEERQNAQGGWDRTVVEPRWAVVHVQRPPARGSVEMLLAERLVATSHSDAEGTESELAVTGWLSGKGRFDSKAWAFTAAADDGAVQGEHDLFMTTKHGCCGAEDVHDWYSLRTGKLAATSTAGAAAFVAIPNTTTERILTFQGVNGQRQPRTPAPVPQLLGVLTLGGHDGPIRRVALTASGVEPWTPELRLQAAGKAEETANLDLWAADKNPSPRGIRGFKVKLAYEGHAALWVPVEGDDLDVARAAVPSPFHLLRLADRPPPG